MFARNQGGADQWGQVKKLIASDGVDFDRFGYTVAISGDTVMAGAHEQNLFYRGSAYVFTRNQGGADQWGQVKKLAAADRADWHYFGASLAISGDTVVVGATGDESYKGAAYVYQEAMSSVYLPIILKSH